MDQLFITAPGTTRPAQAHHIAEMLYGNVKAKIPAIGFSPVEIQGIMIHAVPLVPGSRFRLRVLGVCPECKRLMAVGRMAQHARIHQIKE